ncbi:hypothetical protein [Halobacillus halophilus]|uniref:hypothetical protein n=1 Tax=Halobacillus halophilus TaxID=1570 RepID=UPI001CD3B1FD|nr:hypothetical protein [Halobacillus halophilus]MCA1012811.1 hypothetical protein [Halobacillus halophilus]
MECIITKNNLDEVFERIVVGLIKAENYNKNCFGTSDLKHAWHMNHVLDTFITKVVDSGYCQHTLLGHTLTKYGYTLEVPQNMALKQEADDDFRIDMSEYERALDISNHVFESTVASINEGHMAYR